MSTARVAIAGVALFGGLVGNKVTGAGTRSPAWVERVASSARLVAQACLPSVASHAPLATDQCAQPGVSCTSGHSIRVGLQAIWTFRRDTSTRPWLGIGTGYEWAGYDVASTSVSYRGWEWGNLQFGVEFDIAPGFTLGPVLSGSVAQYATAQVGDQSGEIARKSIHGWNFIGLRGTFEL